MLSTLANSTKMCYSYDSLNRVADKYVYGRGLIGEEKLGCFKSYHFDSRGSTVAITDIDGKSVH